MNQLRDRLAEANPVPDLPCYSPEQIAATVSMITSDAVLSPGAPARSRSRRRWLALVPVAAGLSALLTVVGVPGRQAESAYAEWTATPSGVSAPDGAMLRDRCIATSTKDFGGHLSKMGELAVVLAERRGSWTYALLANSNNVVSCLHGKQAPTDAQVQSSGKEIAPRPVARGVTTITMVGGGISMMFGRAGAEVTNVVVNVPDGSVVNAPDGRVTATVKDGYWAAWWPDDLLTRPFAPSGAKYSLAVTLRDGTKLPLIRPWPNMK